MAIENDPSARMQFRSVGELVHPAQCMVCGSGTCERGYIDLGVYFDYEGTMYLCYTCCTQAGETLGMFTPEEVRSTQDLAKDLAEKNIALEKELENARPLISMFERSMSAAVNDGVLSTVPAGKGARNTFDLTEGAAEGKPAATKSVKGSGRSDSSKSKSRNITFKDGGF